MNYFNESSTFDTEMKKSFEKTSMGTSDASANMTMGCDCGAMNTPMMGACASPIYECPQERVCHRYICYDVPHIMPCNTRIINHHVYRHSFRPEYTCCEENVCENVYEPRCC